MIFIRISSGQYCLGKYSLPACQRYLSTCIETTARDYMLGVLGRIEPDRKLQLPEDPEAAAAEFLTLLGKHGLVEFLPDDAFIDLPPEDTFAKEDDLCVDK